MRELSNFLEKGFHGDDYLLEIVSAAATQCEQFIETGTNVGSSLHYFARNFPNTTCYSCEPDKDAYAFAAKKCADLENVHIRNEMSPAFLHHLDPATHAKPTLFWLDSHGYGFRWPLRDEIDFITRKFPRACIFIDDFQVPGQPQFLFDEYDGQICGWGEIEPGLRRDLSYQVVYPNYKERTSTFHPLKGWVRIDYGFSRKLDIPAGVVQRVTVSSWPPNP